METAQRLWARLRGTEYTTEEERANRSRLVSRRSVGFASAATSDEVDDDLDLPAPPVVVAKIPELPPPAPPVTTLVTREPESAIYPSLDPVRPLTVGSAPSKTLPLPAQELHTLYRAPSNDGSDSPEARATPEQQRMYRAVCAIFAMDARAEVFERSAWGAAALFFVLSLICAVALSVVLRI